MGNVEALLYGGMYAAMLLGVIGVLVYYVMRRNDNE